MSASQLPTARRAPTSATAPLTSTGRQRMVLDRYRLGRRLGAGGFGEVWAARDERLEREVAIKILPRERIVGGRFEREARAAARLAHPAIVTLYEAAVDDDSAYLVSELVHGETLQHLLADGRLSDRDILAIAISLCDALDHAHGQGVIHRDVKPANVLVAERPSTPAHPAKLTDFGVARVVGGDSLTRTGDVVGTAAYMAPEQAEGRPAAVAADLYALALVVYEALTGINPVRTTTAASRARRLGTFLPPLRRQRRDLPRELGCAVDLALRPRPRERGTVSELRAALQHAHCAVDDTPGLVTGRWPRRPACETDAPEPGAPAARNPGAVGPERAQAPLGLTGPTRAVGGASAALLTVWLTAHTLDLPLSPAAAGGVVALLVMLLPRLGWVAVSVALIAGAALAGSPGASLLLVLSLPLPVLLLPHRGSRWSWATLAPALGLVGLGGAWPGLAGHAGRGPWLRAALGALGWLWLVLAVPLAQRDLYMSRPPSAPALPVWTASPAIALHDVVLPILRSGVLAGALVWALAAAVLPWLARRRSLILDALAVLIWSAVTVVATLAVLSALPAHASGPSAATVVRGAALAGAVALLPSAVSAWRRSRHQPDAAPRLP